ncbi:Succinyl-diaminopimelate desuccinylase [Pseudovibrio axinellae]|uniref:Probable succinyl-diaminopimelate desuccinylase n=1 Tax=Pseudovibrio axinellae TaxID=989403 RepID=A0A165XCE4_9HYPH|nr:ArgE/DapE family deacylase [Pseudovibrio axinellae]KZL17568.1 Succinyl-diaminopimelate desuccinylase [Pseudovibrio axinellae]SER32439.1 acetylornithine deacetylase or succinyl-diaminopimelate desuccinylase [Pseudovibrio axinellae]
MRAAIENRFSEQVGFLVELVKLPSDNPPGDTAQHALRTAELLEKLGFEVEKHPVPEPFVRQYGMVSVTNLIIREKFGYGEGPVIALNAHGDVVPAGEGWTQEPYGATIHDGALYGRGAAVSKGDFATYAFALLALREHAEELDGTVELHLTYDEETGGFVGPKWLLEQELTKPDYAITTGFSYAATTAHNGCLHMEVIFRGKQAHAAMPDTGADALQVATPVLSALYQEKERLRAIQSSQDGIGSPQITVGLISGGVNTNVVPERVSLRIDRRLIPEENGELVEEQLIGLINSAVPQGCGVEVECRRIMIAEPLRELPGAKKLLEALKWPAKEVLGIDLKATGAPLFTDARHYSEAGIPTVLYGAGPRSILEANAHGADEHLQLADLKHATIIIADALKILLR